LAGGSLCARTGCGNAKHAEHNVRRTAKPDFVAFLIMFLPWEIQRFAAFGGLCPRE
jgi:hypothetical protein